MLWSCGSVLAAVPTSVESCWLKHLPRSLNGHSVCRYVPGLNLGEAWEVLKSELAGQPDSGDKLFEAAKFIGKQVLLVSPDSWTYCRH